MIEVVIDSIRVSLMSQNRIVVLKDVNAERYLTIWIGPVEADAITVELQELPPPRPLTHDLLKSTIVELGGKVVRVFINDLRKDVYYARLIVEVNGRQVEIDSRPSDAIALAVRTSAPIFVDESVMERAAREPEEDVEKELGEEPLSAASTSPEPPEKNTPARSEEEIDESKLSAFADFLDSLDLDDLDDNDS